MGCDNKKNEVKIDKRNGETIDVELKLEVKDLKERTKSFETKEEIIGSERKKEELKFEKERKMKVELQ